MLSAAAGAEEQTKSSSLPSLTEQTEWMGGEEEEEEVEEGCDNIISYILELPRLFQTSALSLPEILSGWHSWW